MLFFLIIKLEQQNETAFSKFHASEALSELTLSFIRNALSGIFEIQLYLRTVIQLYLRTEIVELIFPKRNYYV